jgi:hypothetical protein
VFGGREDSVLKRTIVARGLVVLALICTAARADATITVMNTADSGGGSLRDAIATAASGETIDFAPGVTGTIALLSTLSITQPVTIQGPGADDLTIDGQSTVRVLDIAAGGDLTLSGVTILDGSTNAIGGGIQNAGALDVRRCIFAGNAASSGGAIAAQAGSLTTINECTFEENTTTGVGGGALITFGIAMVSNSTFVRNMAPINGGAINVQSGGLATVINCTFFDNSSGSLGGTISNLGVLVVLDSTFSQNQASAGSAIATANDQMTINNNIFADNAASAGPGAFSPATGAASAASNNVFFNNTANGVADDQTGYGTMDFVVAASEPLLPLGDNGGPTETMLPRGAALCAGEVALLPEGLTRDQRGFPRVTSCLDAGAVQISPAAAAPTLSAASLAVAVVLLTGFGLIGVRRRRVP